MNNIDRQYKELLEHIIRFGVEKQDRTGTGTKSIFGWQIRHNMKEGFPLLTTKKMAWKSVVTELLWFLKGDTNIKYLVENGCSIWTGDAYKQYLDNVKSIEDGKQVEEDGKIYTYRKLTKEQFTDWIKTYDSFADRWGELGPIYGKQWRSWKRYRKVEDKEHKETLHIIDYIDQITNLISELKTNPDSRRLMVSAWNVSELDEMVLPPCHYGFQIYTRELTWEEQVQWVMKNTDVELENLYIVEEIAKETTPKRAISLMWNQRSVDTFLGLPFNIASYGLLLLMIADEVNMVPEELIGNLGDTHLYLNHIEQAKEQIDRIPYKLPTVKVQDGIFCSSINDIQLENYQSHPAIKAPLSN